MLLLYTLFFNINRGFYIIPKSGEKKASYLEIKSSQCQIFTWNWQTSRFSSLMFIEAVVLKPSAAKPPSSRKGFFSTLYFVRPFVISELAYNFPMFLHV